MPKITPIRVTEQFQHFLEELKDSFWGDLYGKTRLAWEKLFDAQSLYRETGGVHTSGLCDGEKIVISAEDIGRHNTLDKIAGLCLMKNVWPETRILITTGRISSEMLQKAARMQAPILISRTSPSSLSIEMAERYGITLIGYARKHRFNVYSNKQRIDSSVP